MSNLLTELDAARRDGAVWRTAIDEYRREVSGLRAELAELRRTDPDARAVIAVHGAAVKALRGEMP